MGHEIRSGAIEIVINLFESGSIGVLEKITPVVICTHDSEKAYWKKNKINWERIEGGY